jgi:hypothetical protein
LVHVKDKRLAVDSIENRTFDCTASGTFIGKPIPSPDKGGFDATTRRRLRQLGKTFRGDPRSTALPDTGPRPGIMLVREWNGVTHRVMVLDEGFAWNGQKHGSLSDIAFRITGTRWSGPRFFGLRQQPKS